MPVCLNVQHELDLTSSALPTPMRCSYERFRDNGTYLLGENKHSQSLSPSGLLSLSLCLCLSLYPCLFISLSVSIFFLYHFVSLSVCLSPCLPLSLSLSLSHSVSVADFVYIKAPVDPKCDFQIGRCFREWTHNVYLDRSFRQSRLDSQCLWCHQHSTDRHR